jgi:hypothetical protein
MTTRKVTIDVSYAGTGRVVGDPGGFAFSGGIVPPELADKITFLVEREVPDEDGLWNPTAGEPSLTGGLQVNIWADSEGYRELGRYFLALAELDSTADPGFHEHHEGLKSADGRTRLHIICRKASRKQWPIPPGAEPDHSGMENL